MRAAILLLLAEQPRHGYDLIQEIADRSAGTWTPSPGSVYPTLQSLEDEGLVTIENVAGRKTASLTEAGTEYVEENRESFGTPWDTSEDRDADLAIRREILALKDAATQVVRVGGPEDYTAAAAVLADARRELYRILASDGDGDGGGGGGGDGGGDASDA
ncbi:MAG TPA: PadR family transcriptional regulator [Actinomycetaceae bacterium]|nr:PadR family transcriptional regulator [Actinomycetaceae bacterium]